VKTSNFKKLPVIVSAGSFLALVVLLLSTDPLAISGVILAFFGLLLIMLLSLVRLLVYSYHLKPRSSKKVVVWSVAAVSALMLKSAQSLNPLELISLALIGFGLFFYISRRD
jgi:hypothetical protein